MYKGCEQIFIAEIYLCILKTFNFKLYKSMYFLSAGMAYNFDKIDTLNQGTPYDYNSVMQYEKYVQPYVYVTYFKCYSISLVNDQYLLLVSENIFRLSSVSLSI